MNQPIRQQWRRSNGHLLLSAAIVAAVLSILVSGYLTWVTNEYVLSDRSHRWAQTLYLCEAGVELGLAELNYPYSTGGSTVAFQTSSGWRASGSSQYTKAVSNLVDATGAVIGNFTVTVNVGSANPVVTCQGTQPAGVRGSCLTRTVSVVATPRGRFAYAFVTKTLLTTLGFNLTTDSFDSSDPNKSTNGLYDATAGKKQPNGDIATIGNLANLQITGNTDIYGRLMTGSALTFQEVLLGTTLGSTFVTADRATSIADGAAKGWVLDNIQIDTPDVALPFNAASASSLGLMALLGGTLNGGDWQTATLALTGNETLTIKGHVRIYVSVALTLLNNAQIIITPGSQLEVYAGGTVALLGGGVTNETGLAVNNQFYGLPLSLIWNVNGQSPWIGTIDAPSAVVTMLGVGGNPNVSGAIICNSLVLAANLNLHYDESLKKSIPGTGYSVAGWQSLMNRNGSWVLETN